MPTRTKRSMRIAALIAFCGLLCVAQAPAQQSQQSQAAQQQAQQTAQQATPETSSPRRPAAVRVFDEDTIGNLTGHIAYGGEGTAPAPAAQPKASTSEAHPEAHAAPAAQMTPEEVEKLRAHQQSLEKTLAQIDAEITKAPDAAGRDALELMRTNVRNNLNEVREAIAAQTKSPSASQPPAEPEAKTKTPAEDHPPL
jgi:hypothetical protein